jgi:hypothetical protein
MRKLINTEARSNMAAPLADKEQRVSSGGSMGIEEARLILNVREDASEELIRKVILGIKRQYL